MLKYYIWDLETMLNCFLFTGKFDGASEYQVFEISDRMNQRNELLQWFSYLQNAQVHMVGYNTLGFDYPIAHNLLTNPWTFDAAKANLLAQEIIHGQSYGRPQQFIPLRERIIPQIDLVKINHFDNPAKRTPLKSIQFAMRSESVEDLPFPFDKPLNSEQIDVMRSYNLHDVTETEKFLGKCKYMIDIRKELIDNGVLSGDVLNYSDVKVGTEYLIKKIGRAKCFVSGSTPRQTIRTSIPFNSIILPKIQFRTERFDEVLEWFGKQIVYPKGKDRPSLEAKLGGLAFDFGVGGVHASVENRVFETTDTHVIKDIDVSSMYPSVAIANGFAPEHLGAAFSQAYKQLSSDRKQHAKGSTMNLVLKFANNGVFGMSNNPYSCLYDPKFTYSITVNGQLQLLQLVELLSMIPGLELIQANTDGVTALVPRNVEYLFNLWCDDWESQTGLKLEHKPYAKMWIRDVNNYLALGMDGEIKRKGAYWYPITEADYQGSSGSNWNKDFSNMVAQKAIEQVFLYGHAPRDIVRCYTDPFDFMLRYKTPAGAKVFIGSKEMSKTVRYYASTAGEAMKKVAAPKGKLGAFKRKNKLKDEFYEGVLKEVGDNWDARIHTGNKSRYAEVTTSIESGFRVKCCNKASDFNWADVDYAYYEKEINKLRIPNA